ncbi:MAG: GNAT family N-acetyltransferase [Deltaproteobacteria bacterium]|nr:GNAT family N-acetyltransferase [Deltaproteobacteria bacterium]
MKGGKGIHGDSFSVRVASPNDAPAIAVIHVVTWQRVYRGIMSDAFLDSLQPWQRESMWQRVLSEGSEQVHVCSGPAGIVGFSSAGPCRDSTTVAEIYAIYVHPYQWGQGYGWVLFSESCAAMLRRGFEHLVLWVATENDQARAFYERAGMVADGATKTASFGDTQVEEIRYRLEL